MKNEFIHKAQSLVATADDFLEKSGADKFHEKAAELLQAANLHKLFDVKDYATLALSPDLPEKQSFRFMEFSDLPVTIARGKNCFIDLYCWKRRPTTIHNHHFMGAFQCLFGENIDTEYSFNPKQELSKLHTLGTLIELRRKEIKSGHIQAIDLQDKFIHQNHHHSDITVNLCFRTVDNESYSLSSFLYSGLKCEKHNSTMALTDKIFKLSLITEFNPELVNVSNEVAMTFLIETFKESNAPQFKKVQEYLNNQIEKKFGLSMLDFLEENDRQVSDFELSYY